MSFNSLKYLAEKYVGGSVDALSSCGADGHLQQPTQLENHPLHDAVVVEDGHAEAEEQRHRQDLRKSAQSDEMPKQYIRVCPFICPPYLANIFFLCSTILISIRAVAIKLIRQVSTLKATFSYSEHSILMISRFGLKWFDILIIWSYLISWMKVP